MQLLAVVKYAGWIITEVWPLHNIGIAFAERQVKEMAAGDTTECCPEPAQTKWTYWQQNADDQRDEVSGTRFAGYAIYVIWGCASLHVVVYLMLQLSVTSLNQVTSP